jgi:hypothetical protein
MSQPIRGNASHRRVRESSYKQDGRGGEPTRTPRWNLPDLRLPTAYPWSLIGLLPLPTGPPLFVSACALPEGRRSSSRPGLLVSRRPIPPARLASDWLAGLCRMGIEPNGSLRKVSGFTIILLSCSPDVTNLRAHFPTLGPKTCCIGQGIWLQAVNRELTAAAYQSRASNFGGLGSGNFLNTDHYPIR